MSHSRMTTLVFIFSELFPLGGFRCKELCPSVIYLFRNESSLQIKTLADFFLQKLVQSHANDVHSVIRTVM